MKFFIKKRITIISIFIGFLSLVPLVWYTFFYEKIPNLITSRYDLSLPFDYVIVGAGTCGSVLASVLSEKLNASILLIEAGHTFGILSRIPMLSTFIQKGENDWKFLTVPQNFSSKSIENQQQCLPRGKGLGGSSQMNFMLHYPGNKREFDQWKLLGLKSWNFESMKPYLHRQYSKSIYQELRRKSKIQSNLNIWKLPKNFSLLTEVFEKAKIEFVDKNLNFHRTELTISNGLRSNVYQLYLRPSFEFENMKIITNAFVKKIIFKDKRAVGLLVEARYLDTDRMPTEILIKVSNEIILSAGAYQTPNILQKSGIGPKKVLESANIPVIVDSPQVGENLNDQLTLPLYVSIKKPVSVTVDKILTFKEIWKFFTTTESVLSTFGVIGNFDAKNDTYGTILFGTGTVDERVLMKISNFIVDDFRQVFPFTYNTSQEGFVLLSTCYGVESRGTVRINKNNYDPIIDPNFLHSINDVQCLIRAIRTAVKVIRSESFKILGPEIHWPTLKQCSQLGPFTGDFETDEPSDQYLECVMRHVALSAHHPAGSCRMGVDPESPVDENLRVRGVAGLRVLDASVLPKPISGPQNSILISMARKFADELIAGR